MRSAITLSTFSILSIAGLAVAQCESAKQASCESWGDAQATIVRTSLDSDKDIVATAVAAGNFKTLAAALQAAGLVEALQGKGPFTVFAPTDEAFAKLPAGTVETLLKPENKERLISILKYHVVPSRVLAKDVKAGPVVTLDGQRFDITTTGNKVMVDQATVTATDVMAKNGVIHVIDRVILPSDKSIVATAVEAGSFTTLAKLLTAADLIGALEAKGPFTVFAPTDEAFAKLPKETLDSLMRPENKAQLTKILTYHVIPGRVFSDAAAKGATVKTLNGQEVTTRSESRNVMVGNAKVITADIDAVNGVIHVIDTVLLPK